MSDPFKEGEYNSSPNTWHDFRHPGRGPRIVAIGGGHGQAATLRGLKHYTHNLTAIVTVADDGGSSGRLRREFGILPPGDFRNCIAALANDEALMTRLFQYRFATGAGLEGHSFGNLFISAMAEISGSFETALKESSQVLAIQGQVLPSTLQTVTLCADIQKTAEPPLRVRGESQIPKTNGKILRVTLDPDAPPAYPEAIHAILKADLVVIGPGSLYTSILPNLLVPTINQALKAVRVPKVYICNIATQKGETDGYTAQAHLDALETHLGKDTLNTIIVNKTMPRAELPPGISWVAADVQPTANLQVVEVDLVDEALDWRHNSDKLARAIMQILKRRSETKHPNTLIKNSEQAIDD